MKISIQTKRLALRIATGFSAAYAFEPTREMAGNILSYQIGPLSLLSIVGLATAYFVWGNIKHMF